MTRTSRCLLSSSRRIVVVVQSLHVLSSLRKFCPISSRLSCFPSRCSRYAAEIILCFFESFPLHYSLLLSKSYPFILASIVQPVLIGYFYHTGCQVELVVLFFGIETVIGIEMMTNLHHRLLRRKS